MRYEKYIIIAGVPCAGKSTVSLMIMKRMGFQHIRMDSIIVRWLHSFYWKWKSYNRETVLHEFISDLDSCYEAKDGIKRCIQYKKIRKSFNKDFPTIHRCGRWDLNPHERIAHKILSLARLPVPTLPHACTALCSVLQEVYYHLGTNKSIYFFRFFDFFCK